MVPRLGSPAGGGDAAPFDYTLAFSRTIGWVTAEEQAVLRRARVAIGGLGGVGGAHLLTLTRLGVSQFHIADPDAFELANFNRQAGASMRSLGRPKVDVMAELVSDINPEADLRCFSEGVTDENLDAFLDGVDVYVDGLDLFAIGMRRRVFAKCAARGIPAVTAAPMGMGAALLVFMPERMTFEEYFALEGHGIEEQVLRFLIGLAPAVLQRAYIADPAALDLGEQRAPSTPIGIELCAGLAATHVLKILCGRGRVLPVPWALQFDAYRQRLRRTWRPGGNRNPIQRLTLFMARRALMGRFRGLPRGG